MPYRRLPNTDKARLAALEKAVAMEHECDVDKQAASYKTLNEARVLLRRFKSAVEQFQYCYTAQAEANRQYQSHLKTARLYISHFIQVLNLAVLRNEVRKEQQVFLRARPRRFCRARADRREAHSRLGRTSHRGGTRTGVAWRRAYL